MRTFETVVNKTEGSITVLFRGLSQRVARVGSYISSSTVSLAGHPWEIRLYPEGVVADGWVSCYLVNKAAHPVTASFTLILASSSGQRVGNSQSSQESRFEAWVENEEYPAEKSMWGTLGMSLNRGRSDMITVHATISVTEPVVCSGSPAQNPTKPNNTTIHHMLTSGHLSDFTVVAGTDAQPSISVQRIPVHKLILSLRSPVFKTMLESGLSESACGEVRISASDASAVQELVRFLYTDNCDVAHQAEPLLVLCAPL
jgi:speckle-type POZ protein